MALKKQKQKWFARNAILAVAFIVIYLIQSGSYIKSMDQRINVYLSGYDLGFLTGTMTFITNAFGPLVIFIFSILITFLMIRKHKYLLSKIFAAHILCSLISFTFIKLAVQRVRPSYKTMHLINEFSFPSGHATMSVAFYGFLVWTLHHKTQNKTVLMFFDFLVFTIVVLVGFSRIFLNYHWFTDVVGGYILGLFWLSVFSYPSRRFI